MRRQFKVLNFLCDALYIYAQINTIMEYENLKMRRETLLAQKKCEAEHLCDRVKNLQIIFHHSQDFSIFKPL